MREAYPNELYHHGIPGQKWGKRNGPPYPLNTQTHMRVVKNSGGSDSVSNGGANLPNKLKAAANGVNPGKGRTNCKDVAFTVANNIATDKHGVASSQNTVEGNISDYIEHYYGNSDNYVDHVTGSKENVESFIKKNYNNGEFGCISVTYDPKYVRDDTSVSAHAFNWAYDDPDIYMFDGQPESVNSDMSYIFKRSDQNKEIELVRYSKDGIQESAEKSKRDKFIKHSNMGKIFIKSIIT